MPVYKAATNLSGEIYKKLVESAKREGMTIAAWLRREIEESPRLGKQYQIRALQFADRRKVPAVKAVRSVSGFGLRDALALVNSLPRRLPLRYDSPAAAESAMWELREAGVSCEIVVSK